jgi:uncharacterized protein YkwD
VPKHALLIVVCLSGSAAFAAVAAPASPGDDARLPEPLAIEAIAVEGDESPVDLAEGNDLAPPASPEQQVIELVNQERQNCTVSGCPLPPMKRNSMLDLAAERHGVSMAGNDFFGHCDFVTHSLPWDRMVAVGYFWNGAAENIAAGTSTASGAMALWMGSAGHRANILNTGNNELGVGYVQQAADSANILRDTNSNCAFCESGETCPGGPFVHYWIQVFGRRSGVYPVVIEREKHSTASANVALHVYGPTAPNDMRFSNDGVTWSNWQAYSTTKSWTLAAGDGLRTVFSQVRKGSIVYGACDSIWRTGAGGSELFVDRFECDGLAGWSAIAP